MQTKILEVRDRMTMIGVVAVRISRDDGPLARRCGYGDPCVLLARLQGGQAFYDAFSWADRTMTVAHSFIEKAWLELESGDVVDVEFILGETTSPKCSEVGA